MSERFNNRKNDELREISFIKDYTKHALSSVLVQFGDTKVIVTASVDEKAPKWMEKMTREAGLQRNTLCFLLQLIQDARENVRKFQDVRRKSKD